VHFVSESNSLLVGQHSHDRSESGLVEHFVVPDKQIVTIATRRVLEASINVLHHHVQFVVGQTLDNLLDLVRLHDRNDVQDVRQDRFLGDRILVSRTEHADQVSATEREDAKLIEELSVQFDPKSYLRASMMLPERINRFTSCSSTKLFPLQSVNRSIKPIVVW
jgi:hypothetical protein